MRSLFERLIEIGCTGRLRQSAIAACLLGIAALIGTAPLQAQEAVRYALSRQLLTAPQPLKQPTFINLAPLYGQLTAGLGMFVDDNANLTKTDTHSELVFDQSLDLNLNWVLSHLNELGFKFGGTLYEVVGGAPGEQKLQLAIDPGSNIDLKIFVGDFLIRLYNYLSVVQDPTQNPAVSGQSNLNQLTNNAGIAVDWDLSKLILTAGFDYSYFTDLGGGSGGSTGNGSTGNGSTGNGSTGNGSTTIRNTIRPSLAAALALTPTMNTGLEGNYSASFGAGSNDVDGFSVGPFLRGKLTRFITVDLSGGLYLIQPPHQGDDWYLSLNLRHLLTPYISYGAGFNRELQFAGGTGLSRNNAFTLDVAYLLRRNLTLDASGSVNFGEVLQSDQSVGVLPGKYVQYELGIRLSWRIARRITTSLAYRFIDRNADQGTYKQNRADLGIRYAF